MFVNLNNCCGGCCCRRCPCCGRRFDTWYPWYQRPWPVVPTVPVTPVLPVWNPPIYSVGSAIAQAQAALS